MKVTPEDILGTEVLLVGRTGDVLVVGKKRKGDALELINAFQGAEAEELYKKLITMKENKNDSF